MPAELPPVLVLLLLDDGLEQPVKPTARAAEAATASLNRLAMSPLLIYWA
jgi:hypothetical protein